jgi:lysophospholipase L1-like esterase
VTAILCYGDSNTWGYQAATAERLGRWERWPGVLQRTLGDVHVIEEGQNGRTTVFDVPFEPDRNGLTYLPVALQTHHPVDLVVIDLGTNDLFLPGVNAYHAAHGAIKLAEIHKALSQIPPADNPYDEMLAKMRGLLLSAHDCAVGEPDEFRRSVPAKWWFRRVHGTVCG